MSTSGIGSAGCPRVLVARRHGGTCRSEVHACTRTLESTNAETENEREREVDGALIEEDDEEMDVAPSRAVKHKSVEQRRKKKISEGIQQLLETLRPASPAGKMVRTKHSVAYICLCVMDVTQHSDKGRDIGESSD